MDTYMLIGATSCQPLPPQLGGKYAAPEAASPRTSRKGASTHFQVGLGVRSCSFQLTRSQRFLNTSVAHVYEY